MPHSTYYVAIIGLGPKGLYAFERLCAELKASGSGRPVQIHLFNDHTFWGAGHNFRFDQGEHLLINFNIGYVDMWPTEGPPPVVPRPRSLTQWLQEQTSFASVTERSFVSRAAVGRYLHASWREILDHLPNNVEVVLYPTRVDELCPVGRRWQITTGSNGQLPLSFDQVLLTTGHQRNLPNAEVQACRAHCAQHRATHYIDYVYPAHERLAEVPSGTDVAVKGMGLTYVDTVLELTEGRGGKFIGDELRGYTYRPSGREPRRIYPFSRSGLPMFPRGDTFAIEGLPLRYFTEERLARLVQRRGRLEWHRDLLPLLRADQYAAYYHHVLLQHGEQLPEKLNIGELYRRIAVFHRQHPEVDPFHPEQLYYGPPIVGNSQHADQAAYFQQLTVAAAVGEQSHPLTAATAVWRYANPVFSKVYQFGGLSPKAQKTFLKTWAGNLNRLTYGMPLRNALKLLALVEAGLLDFSYARSPEVRHGQQGGFELHVAQQPLLSVSTLIDARIPQTSLEHDAGPLFQQLFKRNLIRPYVNGRYEQTSYTPGCLDLEESGTVLDGQGRAHHGLSVTGIPTEGITFDNDTLSISKNNFGPAWAERVARSIANFRSEPSKAIAV